MIKSWLIYLAGLVATLVFHACYFGWYSWFVLQIMVLLPLFSFLVSLPAMLRVRVSADASPVCGKADNAYIRITVQQERFPLPRCRFRISVRNCMSGKISNVRKHMEGAGSWYAKLDTSHVGLLRCRVEKASVYDYLRLFCVPIRCGQVVEVLVRPQPEEPAVLPNLTHFLTKNLKPKAGGGFSEEHELRDYRPGDPLRDIHWKLSAKTDQMILREAQEPAQRNVLLTLDLIGSQDQIDSVLGRFVWMSRWLLEHEVAHELRWFAPEDLRMETAQITDEKQLERVMEQLLSSALKPDIPSIAEHRFGGVDWRYHIPTVREVKA